MRMPLMGTQVDWTWLKKGLPEVHSTNEYAKCAQHCLGPWSYSNEQNRREKKILSLVFTI